MQRLGVREVGLSLERAHLLRHERVDAHEHLLECREELVAHGLQVVVRLALLDVVDLQLELLVVDVVSLPAGVLHVDHAIAELHHGGDGTARASAGVSPLPSKRPTDAAKARVNSGGGERNDEKQIV